MFSPDSKILATNGKWKESAIRFVDTRTGRTTQTFSGYKVSVKCVAFSPDGKTLASGGSDGSMRLWDISTGKHKKEVYWYRRAIDSVGFSPDGKQVVYGTIDRNVLLWDIAADSEQK